MTRTASARLVGHNYRHIGVTFGKPWERIDTANPYFGRHRAHAVRLTSDGIDTFDAECDCGWGCHSRGTLPRIAVDWAEGHAFQHRATVDLGGVA